MNKQVGKELLTKYLNGTANEQEKLLVEQWYASLSVGEMSPETEEDYARIKSEMWSSIDMPKEPKPIPLYRQAWVRMAAAIVILMISVAVYYVWNSSSPDHIHHHVSTDSTRVIKPGGIGATLTLSDGRQIKLSDASEGELAEEAGISIFKSEDGLLAYEVENVSQSTAESTHVLTTAKGETYMVVLPDKSKVWLNASSSLTFSTHYRRVTLDGEGYFEIAKDQRPFVVVTRDQEVEVLGTHFNINAYADEDKVKTSLVEGKVRVITKGTTRDLSPGQQAVNDGGRLAIQEVDMENIIAWKNGFFKFDGNLETVMRTIARWYDIELAFASDAPKEVTLWGYVSRSNELEAVLRQLERTNKVDFTLQGREITVKRAK